MPKRVVKIGDVNYKNAELVLGEVARLTGVTPSTSPYYIWRLAQTVVDAVSAKTGAEACVHLQRFVKHPQSCPQKGDECIVSLSLSVNYDLGRCMVETVTVPAIANIVQVNAGSRLWNYFNGDPNSPAIHTWQVRFSGELSSFQWMV